MSCDNCNCPSCVEDRERIDLKTHRLKVINSWNWNLNTREARKELKEELKTGRGGEEEAWFQEISSFFNENTAILLFNK